MSFERLGEPKALWTSFKFYSGNRLIPPNGPLKFWPRENLGENVGRDRGGARGG